MRWPARHRRQRARLPGLRRYRRPTRRRASSRPWRGRGRRRRGLGAAGRLLRQRAAGAAARSTPVHAARSTCRCCRSIFDIAMGVRAGDDALRPRLDAALAQRPGGDRRDPRASTACRGSTRRSAGAMRRAAAASAVSSAAGRCSPAAIARNGDSAANARREPAQRAVAVTTAGARGRPTESGQRRGAKLRGERLRTSQGKRLYTWYNCNGCHANGGGGMGPALMDDKWIYGSDDRADRRHHPRGPAERHAVVRRPHSGRPGLADRRLRALDERAARSTAAAPGRKDDMMAAPGREPAAGCRSPSGSPP